MANTCDTTYKITGSRKAVKDLWHVLQDMSAGSKNIWLSDLADYYGIDWQKKGISVRGHIYHSNLESRPEDDFYLLTIDTESAWTGCHDFFHAVSDVLWGELTISYREIEPGCDIFYVHDEADFFPEECVVDSSGAPFDDVYAEPYATIDEAIDDWCRKTGIGRDGRSRDEMLDFIGDYEYDDDDVYYYIHPLIRE